MIAQSPQTPTTGGERRALLARFPQREQSSVANLFLYQYRGQAWVRSHEAPAHALVLAVMNELSQRLQYARRRLWSEDSQKLQRWWEALESQPEEVLAYAEWCVEWENLPRHEREAIKAARGEEHRQAYLDQQPPTAAQLSYLRKLGYIGDPPRSKRHASQLIERMKCGRRGGMVSVE